MDFYTFLGLFIGTNALIIYGILRYYGFVPPLFWDEVEEQMARQTKPVEIHITEKEPGQLEENPNEPYV